MSTYKSIFAKLKGLFCCHNNDVVVPKTIEVLPAVLAKPQNHVEAPAILLVPTVAYGAGIGGAANTVLIETPPRKKLQYDDVETPQTTSGVIESPLKFTPVNPTKNEHPARRGLYQ